MFECYPLPAGKKKKPRSNATGLSFKRVGMKCLKGRCCQAFLFCECIKANPRSHMIDTASEIDVRWLEGCESIGICGATSTPKWLMEECKVRIEELLAYKM